MTMAPVCGPARVVAEGSHTAAIEDHSLATFGLKVDVELAASVKRSLVGLRERVPDVTMDA